MTDTHDLLDIRHNLQYTDYFFSYRPRKSATRSRTTVSATKGCPLSSRVTSQHVLDLCTTAVDCVRRQRVHMHAQIDLFYATVRTAITTGISFAHGSTSFHLLAPDVQSCVRGTRDVGNCCFRLPASKVQQHRLPPRAGFFCLLPTPLSNRYFLLPGG